MKRILKSLIAVICILTLTFSLLTFAVSAKYEVDEEFAKENGYTIYDAGDGIKYYLDADNNIPNEIMVTFDNPIDITKYENEEISDFYGVSIYWADVVILNEELSMYIYLIHTVDFYTPDEAKVLFAGYDEIISASLSWLEHPDGGGETNIDDSFSIDEEFAKENGYTIYDAGDGIKRYLDADNNVPNEIIVSFNNPIDITKYENEEISDFYGVSIYSAEMIILNEELSMYIYLIHTVGFYTPDEAAVLFDDCDEIKNSQLNAIVSDGPVIVSPTDILGDVNFNGEIDSIDYILVKRVYFGTYKLKDGAFANADINQNGEIDSMDYILLKRMYFGTYTPDIQPTPDEA